MGMELIMENIHEANKHLTYEERTFIEIGLNQGRNYTEIAKDINKDRRTIAREIEKHKFKRKPGSFNGKRIFVRGGLSVINLIVMKQTNVIEKKFVNIY